MRMEFEQLANESNKAFEAFSLYLNMGPVRSTANVAKRLGKSKGLIQRWCLKYEWITRVQAYNAHLALMERQAAEVAFRSKASEWFARQEEQREEE